MNERTTFISKGSEMRRGRLFYMWSFLSSILRTVFKHCLVCMLNSYSSMCCKIAFGSGFSLHIQQSICSRIVLNGDPTAMLLIISLNHMFLPVRQPEKFGNPPFTPHHLQRQSDSRQLFCDFTHICQVILGVHETIRGMPRCFLHAVKFCYMPRKDSCCPFGLQAYEIQIARRKHIKITKQETIRAYLGDQDSNNTKMATWELDSNRR